MGNTFIVRDNVPILDEHVLKDEDGQVLIHFTPEKLRAIAAKNNRRIKETGDLIPLVIGHTKDGEPETKQPEIVGYAKNLRVGPFKKTGKVAIHAKFYFFRDKVHLARNFPRRSIELWLPDAKIDPISLLGASTPERDLGLLQLAKTGAVLQFASGGRRKYKRLLSDATTEKRPKMDEKAIVNAVMAALKQTAVWKWCESQMEEQEGQDEEGTDELAPEGEIIPEDEEQELPADEGEVDANPADEEQEEEEAPVRYQSGPSGSNTFTPGSGKKTFSRSKPVANTSKQIVRFQRTLAQMAQENEKLRLQFQRSERERDLMELAAEGCEFNPEEELEYVSNLPDDHYQYHLERIKKRYQRSPIGPARFDLSMSRLPKPAPQGRTKEQMREIAALATKKGISYEQAVAEMES